MHTFQENKNSIVEKFYIAKTGGNGNAKLSKEEAYLLLDSINAGANLLGDVEKEVQSRIGSAQVEKKKKTASIDIMSL